MDQGKREFTYCGYTKEKPPLLGYTVAYLCGILIGNKYTLYPSILLIITGTATVLSLLMFHFSYRRKSLLAETTLPLILITTFVLLGWLSICLSGYPDLKRENSHLVENKRTLVSCIIKEKPVKRAKSNKVAASLHEFGEGIILYLDKNYPDSVLEVGDTIKAWLTPKIIRNNADTRFDYKRYMEKQGVYFTSFVKADEIELHKRQGRSLSKCLSAIKQKYIRKIAGLTGNGQEAATLIAITIGDKSYLDSEIKNDYSKSGTMHLLAVSGLHVGFIYSFLSYLLFIIGNSRFSRVSRFCLINTFLWCYAALVGFAPSVTRAVIMATLYEICKITERDKIGLNTLSLSALIITIFSPQAIFDVGFQLSYTALLSILIIHPKIDLFFSPKNHISKYIWATVSISLACQIGTGLISVSKFGYFPTYFLLSNLIAIPLSAIILYVALGQLVFLGNDTISEIIANLLVFLLRLLNGTVERIESMPYSTIGISLSNGQIVSILLLVILYSFEIIKDPTYRKYISMGLTINLIMCSL